MEELTDKQFMLYKGVFETFDNGTGVIKARQLVDAMRKIGYKPTDSEVQNWLKRLKMDPNSDITVNDFCILMRTVIHDEEMCELFKIFDTDGDGFISATELLLNLSKLGEKVTEDDIAEIIRIADTDGDNLINFEEFIALIQD